MSHAEKCCHLVTEHKASARRSAPISSIPPVSDLQYIHTLYKNITNSPVILVSDLWQHSLVQCCVYYSDQITLLCLQYICVYSYLFYHLAVSILHVGPDLGNV